MKALWYTGATASTIAAIACGIASTQRTPVVPTDPAVMLAQGVVQVEYQANRWAIAPALGFLALGAYLGVMAGQERKPEPQAVAPAPAPAQQQPKPVRKPQPLPELEELGDVWEEPAPQPEPKPEPPKVSPIDSPRYQWMKHLVDSAKLWLIGGEGSGKTSKTEWLVDQYVQRDYEVWVIDPHAAAGQWDPLKVYGRGQNWESVNRGIEEFCKETTRRIGDRGSVKYYDPLEDEKRLILICEEMSAWADKVDPAILRDFYAILPGDLRKANVGVVFVAHGATLAFIGGDAATGKKKNIETTFTRLHCFSEPIPGTNKYRPLPYANLQTPKNTTPTKVDVPEWMRGSGEHLCTCDRLREEKQAMKAKARKVVEFKAQTS